MNTMFKCLCDSIITQFVYFLCFICQFFFYVFFKVFVTVQMSFSQSPFISERLLFSSSCFNTLYVFYQGCYYNVKGHYSNYVKFNTVFLFFIGITCPIVNYLMFRNRNVQKISIFIQIGPRLVLYKLPGPYSKFGNMIWSFKY